MIRFSNLPIHKKLIVIIMSVTLSTLLLASTFLIIYDTYQVREIMSNELANSAHLLGNRSSAALVFDDQGLANENLHALQELPHISMGCIYRVAGGLFASYTHAGHPQSSCPKEPKMTGQRVSFDRSSMHLTLPIKTKNKNVGYIYLRSSMAAINQRVQQQVFVILLLMSVVGLFAFWLSRKLQKFISRPLSEVARVAIRIEEQGDYSQRAPIGTNDEIGQLSKSFNAMLETIEKQNQELTAAKSNLEIQVKNRTHELETANKELESFSYSVSHDLRAPLRSISGFSQILLEDYLKTLDAGGQDLLTRVIDNTQRMSELIEDLLELSRLGRKEIVRVSVDVEELVEDIVESLRADGNERNVEFSTSNLGTVIADQGLLKIVFENILGNAWKYTSKLDKACIELGKTNIQGEEVFYVRDNGAGFDMAFADKIFGAFQRLHNHDEFEGTGIGLATVQRIIHRHGGRIWAEAEPEKGAIFYFTLASVRKNNDQN